MFPWRFQRTREREKSEKLNKWVCLYEQELPQRPGGYILILSRGDSKSQLRTQDGIRVERKGRKDVLAVSALRGSCGPTAHGFLSCLNRLHLQNTRPSSFRSYLRPEIQSQKHRGGSSLHLGPSGCLYGKREKSEGLG